MGWWKLSPFFSPFKLSLKSKPAGVRLGLSPGSRAGAGSSRPALLLAAHSCATGAKTKKAEKQANLRGFGRMVAWRVPLFRSKWGSESGGWLETLLSSPAVIRGGVGNA